MSKNLPPVPNIKGRGINGFYRDVVREMKHVHWPTRHETTRLSGIVLGMCLILAALMTAFSFIIEQGLKMVGIGR